MKGLIVNRIQIYFKKLKKMTSHNKKNLIEKKERRKNKKIEKKSESGEKRERERHGENAGGKIEG